MNALVTLTAPSLSFDASAYANGLRLAGNAFRNSEKNSNTWASLSLAGLLLGEIDSHTIALALYAEMKPLTAKGKQAAPSVNATSGNVSVSSIRGGAGKPCSGGIAAQAAFDALQRVYLNRELTPAIAQAVVDMAISGGKLFAIDAMVKAELAAIAKAKAKAIEDAMPADAAPSNAVPPSSDIPSNAQTIVAFNAFLANCGELDASARLALIETVKAIGAIVHGDNDSQLQLVA